LAVTSEENPSGDPNGAPTEPGATPPDTGSTRARILDTALDLFVEKGFDGTSLREIAEALGVTKAAIYYYFESKDDILMALHMRLHDFGKDALKRLEGMPVSRQLWCALLDELLDQMLTQRKIFLMHERNQAALEKLHREDHDAEHDDIQDAFRRVLADPAVPVDDRIRMASAFGAVFGSLFMAGDAFANVPNAELGDVLRGVLHDVLGP
jgi:AcrR family transcriptional regulator